jgi:hypothetical protein
MQALPELQRRSFCAVGSGVANVLLMRLSGLVSHRIEGGRSCLTVVAFRAVTGPADRPAAPLPEKSSGASLDVLEPVSDLRPLVAA